MKSMKQNLQAVSKELKALAKKTEVLWSSKNGHFLLGRFAA